MARGTFEPESNREKLLTISNGKKVKLRTSRTYKFADNKFTWGITKTKINGEERQIPEVILQDDQGIKINVPMKYFGTRIFIDHATETPTTNEIVGFSASDDNYDICGDLEQLNPQTAEFTVNTKIYTTIYDKVTYPTFIQALTIKAE